MKRAFQVIGICAFTCFSFYYTNKAVDIAKSKDPIMKTINELEDKEIKSVNAIINEDTIKSGVSGKKIDKKKSYEKMKALGKYNENLLFFEEVTPDISIKNNYDKFVIGGNELEKNITLCFIIKDTKYINEILKVLNNSKIKINFFIEGKLIEEDNSLLELIIKNKQYASSYGYDGIYDDTLIKYANSLIYKYGHYINKYCYGNNKDTLKTCGYNNMYTIKGIEVDENYPYTFVKNNLNNGAILTFSNTKEQVRNLDLIIKYIKSKGYSVKDLDNLLTE